MSVRVSLRTLPNRRAARRQHPHRPLRLAARPTLRRAVHRPDRGHRPVPRRRRRRADHPRCAHLAGTRLGRRPRQGRSLRSVPAVRATADVCGRRPTTDRRRQGLPLHLHIRASRRAAQVTTEGPSNRLVTTVIAAASTSPPTNHTSSDSPCPATATRSSTTTSAAKSRSRMPCSTTTSCSNATASRPITLPPSSTTTTWKSRT